MTSHEHPHGEALNIFKFTKDENIIKEDAELLKVFSNEHVKHRKIIVFSIIGAFRKGKSFFLDYCLRFLYAHYPSINYPDNPTNNTTNWLGDENEPLVGFSWKSGTKRDTTGITMWNDIFLHTIATTGEKVAIVVMDTQGLFDNETSIADNSKIFALGSLLSSIQILNLSSQIQEDQLQYLRFATEFAKFTTRDKKNRGNPFQYLLFLIRDWNNPDDYDYGTKGGKKYLDEILMIKSKQESELKAVREFIYSSFDRLCCCLLPHPDSSVATKKNYDGNWKQMNENFRDELKTIIEKILGPDNLVLKKINGMDIKAHEMKEYIETYFNSFRSENLPKIQSVYDMTIEKQMNILIKECTDLYQENVLKNLDFFSEESLQVFHEMIVTNVLNHFENSNKMGDSSHEEKYRLILESSLDELYITYKDGKKRDIKRFNEEKKRIEESMEEKRKLEQEAFEAARQTKEKKDELERQRHMQKIEKEKYDAEMKVLEMRLEVETAKVKQIEAEHKAKEALREQMKSEKKFKKMKEEKENRLCTIS